MYYVYVLKSRKTGKLFKAQSQNVERSLQEHNAGRIQATSLDGPWDLIVKESFPSRVLAARRERYFKSMEGSRALHAMAGTGKRNQSSSNQTG